MATKHVEVIHWLQVPGGMIVIEAEYDGGILIGVQALPCAPDGSRDSEVQIPGWAGQQDAPVTIWTRE